MYRIDSWWWRLRSMWHATLHGLGIHRHPQIAELRAYRKGPRAVRGESPPHPPAWGGPPDDEIGVAVGARMVLASQPRLVIAVTDCVAYSTGFTLAIAVRSKDELRGEQLGFPTPYQTAPDNSSGIRFGIRFSDGREASTAGFGPDMSAMAYYREWSEGKDPQEPVGPIIGQMNGGGGGKVWNFNYFVWPLPPEGPVMITCRWPARGLQTAGKELNGTTIRAAGLKSKSIWS